ncbi:hypothetical protein HKD37_15G044254 [Glycine soja]
MWDLFLREVINEKVDIWVWFRVNEQLPINLQKSLPDRPPESPSSNNHEGVSMPSNRSPPMPRRNPPPPPSSGEPKTSPQPPPASRGGGSGGALGAFWSTQHAKESLVAEDKSKPIFDEEPSSHHISPKHDRILPENEQLPKNVGPNKVVNTQTHTVKSSTHGKLHKPDTVPSKDFEINLFKDKDRVRESTTNFQNQAFNTFVAEFDTTKLNSGLSNKPEREQALEAEVEKLKEQLKEANLEKAEITSKYEKLSAICRSQRQELQDLKQALTARTPSPIRDGLKTSPAVTSSASASANKSWHAFPEEPQQQKSFSAENTSKSVRVKNGQQNKQPVALATDFDSWGFGSDSFSAVPAGSPHMQRPSSAGTKSQAFGEANKSTSQPAGWAGF